MRIDIHLKKLRFRLNKKWHLIGIALLCFSFQLHSQNNVQGTVSDQDEEVLIGVNIQVKGTNKGTASDFDGHYELKDVDENAVLVFSYIGYQSQEVSLEGNETVDVTMLTDAQLLEQVVVVGYGMLMCLIQSCNATNRHSHRNMP